MGSGQEQLGYMEEEDEVFWHIGIIDYLQNYTFKKKAERVWKRFSSPSLNPSTCNPRYYKDRFVHYWEGHILDIQDI